ncbi:MAG: HlyD family efflux transporter periplasmic adaptor subunit [Chloroflexi bacterium]|nr:HlyD family efflux transporter periplasmic adaptor subunit [Chloroflexota bacterium]
MTVRKTLLTLIIVCIAVPLLALGVQVFAQADAQQPQPAATEAAQPSAPVTVATAVPTTTTSAISALGSVEAKAVTELYFQASGTINAVYAEVGDYVQAGDVVADLDATDAWNSYQKALLSLESAQLALDTLKAPATDDEIAVAKANLASAQAAYSSGTDDSQIQQLQLKVDQAQASLTALQTERANMNGSADEIALQEAKIGAQSFNLQIAQLNLEAAQTPDSSSQWSSSIRIQQAQLALDKLQAGPSDDDLKSAQLKIDSAQLSVTDAQNALLKTQLVAPVSGYVTAINSEAGDSASSAIMEISDTSNLQMTVPINELDVQGVSVGQSADVQLDALSGVAIPGMVENVGWLSSTSSDGIVTYDVTIALNTDDSRVRIGMTGEVAINTGSVNS